MSAIIPVGGNISAVSTVADIARWSFSYIDPEYQIWNQLPKEPDSWFERFSEFLAMDPMDRGILKICNRIRFRTNLPPTAALPNEWKLITSAWRWRDRAAAFDDFRKKREAIEEEEMKKRTRQRRLSILSKFQDKVEDAIDQFDLEVEPYNLGQLTSALTAIGKEHRAEFDSNPVQRKEVRISSMQDLLKAAEMEDDNIIEAEYR